MPSTLNAFVLAAGMGERLRPFTLHLPKPLLPIRGQPLLSRTLDRVSALGVDRIGINLFHKPEAVTAWLESSPYQGRVHCFIENSLLGTGGALKNAEAFLRERTFLVHNSDILSGIDLDALVQAHRASGNIATLALHDCPAFNKIAVDDAGRVAGVGDVTMGPGSARILAFTGIAVYDPKFLDFLPPGASSVVDSWLDAIRAGCTVGCIDVTGALWHDIGSPASYAAAVIDTLRREGEWVYVARDAQGRRIDLDGYIVIEEACTFGEGSALRNCIVLPGTHVDAGARFENAIVGRSCHVLLDEQEFLGQSATEFGIPIGVGGSGRRYYRFRENGKTAVRMVCPHDEVDYERHMAYSQFFARHGVPVPHLLRHEPEARRAEFEDLGDLSLYNYLQFPRTADEIEAIYGQVLACLIPLHIDAAREVDECELLANRPFDFGYFRWETAYFLERFVEGLCQRSPSERDVLNSDFDRLARQADALPKAIIHRDFQSQNIMITQGAPRFIDYQGARMGPPAYDIAAVLWDPYYRLDEAMRERLLARYIKLRTHREGDAFSTPAFFNALLICRLQRHMQALGAYGFLSTVRGKLYFQKYIPEGLRLLKQDLAEAAGAYPAIAELVAAL
ncbi:MAG TPA: phosphotransferase [Candidatus Hydrogenedentes bacterium]|nr:phosphotransferase [Candidatus Hydrogenedentota bacterium]